MKEDVFVPDHSEPPVFAPAGWIEWNGGDCPVPAGTLIDVRYQDGQVMLGIPALQYHSKDGNRCAFNWSKFYGGGCIVGYRIAAAELSISPMQAVYGALWRLCTDDQTMLAARRAALVAIGGQGSPGQRDAVCWAASALPEVSEIEILSMSDGPLGGQDGPITRSGMTPENEASQ